MRETILKKIVVASNDSCSNFDTFKEVSIEKLVRPNIQHLQAYSCARDEYKGKEATFLDANENPYDNGYNRYPDPHQQELKAVLSQIKNVPTDQMILGNGSDELIDLIIRSFCEPAQDNMIVFSPGYAMYEVSAAINNVAVKKINLTADFLPDWQTMWQKVDEHTKIIFLCTPNNPTGKLIPLEQIEQVCRKFQGLVLVDEAYIDFTDEPSAIHLLERNKNVLVLQTLSKAWGMAGLRLGMCFSNSKVINILNAVKPPYNISSLTQSTVIELLQDYDGFKQKCLTLKAERQRLLKELSSLGLFETVYDSDANFILAITDQCREIYTYLIDQQIVVRLRDIPPVISGGIRITIGTEEENNDLLKALKNYTA